MEIIYEGAIFFQVLLDSTGTIFQGANNEMTNIMMNLINLYKEWEEEQMGEELTEEKIFIRR